MSATTTIQSPGQLLRGLRESLHFSLRDVERASYLIAEHFNDHEFAIVLSRLSDIESKGVTPSIQRLCSLALIYSVPIERLLAFYGIDFEATARALVGKLPSAGARNRKTTVISSSTPSALDFPILEQAFDWQQTSPIKRFIEEWGTVPVARLKHLASQDFIYAHIGTEDRTMYPLLRPGSFVQVDGRSRRVKQSGWTNDYDRPIYLLEMRSGYACCWCSQPRRDQLILQPHSLSAVEPRVLRYPDDVEVMGTVVGIAMRLDAIAS